MLIYQYKENVYPFFEAESNEVCVIADFEFNYTRKNGGGSRITYAL
jgi:hypothetical protein